VIRQCPKGELFSDPAGREIGEGLIFKAWSVIPQYLPYITLAQISGWVVEWMTEHHGHFRAMFLEALTGKETVIDDINGWIIDQAHQCRIPCDRHEGMRDLVKAKSEEIRKIIEAMEAAKYAESKSQNDIHSSLDSKSDIQPLARVEVKRMGKAKKQREKPGNQEIPGMRRRISSHMGRSRNGEWGRRQLEFKCLKCRAIWRAWWLLLCPLYVFHEHVHFTSLRGE
jgi:hypothetical protein